MRKKLNTREHILIASMLFGLFFGAGNLIFPAKVVAVAKARADTVATAAVAILVMAVAMFL